jgi:chaperone LolA
MSSRRSVWVIIIAGIVCSHPALAITGAEVIDRMEERFAKAKSYSVTFEKRFFWAVLDRKMSREGKIYTRRPRQFRVEVEDGDLVIADGEAIWVYNKANDQVIVAAYENELRTPWEILVEYAEGYAPVSVAETELDGKDAYLVILQPRPDAPPNLQVTRLRVWVGRKDWDLLQVEQLETNDDIRTYVLSDHRRNKKLDDDLFAFSPPDGVEMIDRRRQD